ncbi:hypothetical protein CGRA01v4_04142 [Colletotrichum graminicola]|nr:hypothetical protein CGRA01v4_04142 [Colletotrichum graminicola]
MAAYERERSRVLLFPGLYWWGFSKLCCQELAASSFASQMYHFVQKLGKGARVRDPTSLASVLTHRNA